MPTVGAFDSGWPNLTKGIGTQPDSPPDRPAMFAEKQQTLRPLAYADVPALARFIDHVEGRDDLRERLTAPHVDLLFGNPVMTVRIVVNRLGVLRREPACPCTSSSTRRSWTNPTPDQAVERATCAGP
jgi:hypothetical protein